MAYFSIPDMSVWIYKEARNWNEEGRDHGERVGDVSEYTDSQAEAETEPETYR